jgi:septum formation protein
MQIGVRHEVLVHEIDESVLPEESPLDYVTRLAQAKARSVLAFLQASSGDGSADKRPVLGADTIVVCDGLILGKPADQRDAGRMLELLSGRTHQVHTAVALCTSGREAVAISSSEVTFRSLSEMEIADYWRTGEPVGKAGAYAIQGIAALFISALSGSYSGVMGLPLFETGQMLGQFGVRTGLSSGGDQ